MVIMETFPTKANVFTLNFISHNSPQKNTHIFGYKHHYSNTVQQYIYKLVDKNQLYYQSNHVFIKSYERINSRFSIKQLPNDPTGSYFSLFNSLSFGNKFRPVDWHLSLDIKRYFTKNATSYVEPGLRKLIISEHIDNRHYQHTIEQMPFI